METFQYGYIGKITIIGISIPFLYKSENKPFYEFSQNLACCSTNDLEAVIDTAN